jgi:hypothetical protein
VGFVVRGFFGNMCTCIYCVLYCLLCFLLFRLSIFILICFICTSVRTTDTELLNNNIIILNNIITFINCKWVDNRWQWSVDICTDYEG